jgi:hypothetical protein
MRSAASAKQNDTRLYGYGPPRKLNQHCSGKAARSVARARQAIQGPRATAHNREAPEARKRYQRKQPHSAGGAAGSQGPRSAGGAA